MQDAVDAISDAQFVFGRLKVNVGGAILVGLPDDLIDELDDAGFLVALGNFLVDWKVQVNQGFVLSSSPRVSAPTP